MATKNDIETVIDTDLADASDITATEHRNVLKDDTDSILDELYKTTAVNDTQATTNVFTIFGSDKNYDFDIKKQGGKVTLTGNLFSTASGITAATRFASITDTEYEPSNYTSFLGYSVLTGDTVRMAIYELSSVWYIATLDAVGENEDITFNFSYLVGQ